jgi:hypothetical protein
MLQYKYEKMFYQYNNNNKIYRNISMLIKHSINVYLIIIRYFILFIKYGY